MLTSSLMTQGATMAVRCRLETQRSNWPARLAVRTVASTRSSTPALLTSVRIDGKEVISRPRATSASTSNHGP